MAKKKTTGPETPGTPAAPRRRTSSPSSTRRRATSTDVVTAEPVITSPAEVDRAAEMSITAVSTDVMPPQGPTYDEIAEAAYHRYLQRGGNHGQDFDDWVEAERRLRTRG